MDTTAPRHYVIEVEDPAEGWIEMMRSTDQTEVLRLWQQLPETGITARARLLEVEVVREYRPSTERSAA